MDRPKRHRLIRVYSWPRHWIFGMCSWWIVLLFISACEQSSTQADPQHTLPKAEAEIETSDIHSLSRALPAKPLIIDVRTKAEFERYHIVSAQNYPLSTLPQQLSQLPSEQVIYLVCATGRRSNKAAQLLKANGFHRPINVLAGTEGWKQAGYKLEK